MVVVEGPDLGTEFDILLRSGGIGREPGKVVQLSDPSVSRSHCGLEFRDGTLFLINSGSRNRTLVHGQPVSIHPSMPAMRSLWATRRRGRFIRQADIRRW